MTKRLTDEEAVIMARAALGGGPVDVSDEYPVWMLDGVNVTAIVMRLKNRKLLTWDLQPREPGKVLSTVEGVLRLTRADER